MRIVIEHRRETGGSDNRPHVLHQLQLGRQAVGRRGHHQAVEMESFGQEGVVERLIGGHATDSAEHRNPAVHYLVNARGHRAALFQGQRITLTRGAAGDDSRDAGVQDRFDNRLESSEVHPPGFVEGCDDWDEYAGQVLRFECGHERSFYQAQPDCAASWARTLVTVSANVPSTIGPTIRTAIRPCRSKMTVIGSARGGTSGMRASIEPSSSMMLG